MILPYADTYQEQDCEQSTRMLDSRELNHIKYASSQPQLLSIEDNITDLKPDSWEERKGEKTQ